MMDNLDFIQEILSSKDEYWIVAQATNHSEYGQMKCGYDNILLIALPRSIDRKTTIEDLTLKKVKELLNTQVDTNITLSSEEAPFQYGYRIKDFYRGFPINFSQHEYEGPKPTIPALLTKFFELDSNELDDYKKVMENL